MAGSRIPSTSYCIPLSSLSLCHKCFLQLLITSLFILHARGNSPPQTGDFETILVWPEDTPIGQVIGNITASDADGPESLKFSTDTPDTADLVELSAPRSVPGQPNTRVVDIILKSILDRDYAPRERRLYFTVSDGSSSIPVWLRLFISDVNDVAPQFINLPYDVTIKENTPPGSVIFSGVSAKDPDNGRSLQFSMKSNAQAADAEYLTTFEISLYNGNITLKRPLDYEKHSYYQYIIMAEDDDGLEADPASFVVYVLDVQDTPPNFVNLPYSRQINEDMTVGTSVQQVMAVDGDQGIPNNITYSFESGDFQNFNIDSVTGVISIKTSLDRDSDTMRNTGGVYAMVVKAAEVVPAGQINTGDTTATTLVTITVKDVNDNAPVFSKSTYTATILENMQKDVPVAFTGDVMRVSDIDQGTNSHFALTFIRNGQPYYDFAPLPQEIYSESSVLIRVNNSEELDYEKNQQVVFQVVAKELDTVEKKSSTATVTIDILDMNDNAPVFAQTMFTLNISENVPVGTSVGQYIATDEDSGTYGVVTYTLRGGNGKYRIEESTGILRITGKIDREETALSYLTVEAKDGGGLRTPAEIVVTVLDENDNSPIFRRNDYEGIVREGSPTFIRPLKVEAFDADEDNTPNSQVSYRIASAPAGLNQNFTIQTSTGEISLTQPLDYEKLDPALNGQITLVVEAYDAGSPVRSSQVSVKITVEDVNDFAPVFAQSEYSTNIPENAAEGFVVITVSATDSDATSPNSDFIYRIESGALDKFRVNFETGDVEVDKGADLDRESRDEYTLTLSAIDRGTPPRSGSCILKIKLTDVNDETPVFQPDSRSVEVSENTVKNSPVLLFSATDPDLNSDLVYTIGEVTAFSSERVDERLNVTSTGVKNYFGVESATGQVFVQNQLDRETAVKVILEVVVVDENAESGDQTATGTLTLTILDYNDNRPQFLPSASYTVDVNEADSLQSIVLQVSTTDADDKQSVSYSIGTGTVDAFDIGGDGTVRLKAKLDREKNARVEFQVIARDSGVPPLASTATVTVNVLDDNDNQPIFDQYNTAFQVSEDKNVGYLVTTFHATDKDINDFGTVFYTLEGPDNDDGSFVINETTGELTVAKELDRETKAVYRVDVVASDSKNNPDERKSTRSQSITITITDVDDNPPVFTRVVPENPAVPESSPPDQAVATVSAEDADDSNTDNGRIIFTLTTDTNATQRNGAPLFKIHASTGVISSTVTLDGYAGIYYITVQATNQAQNFVETLEISVKIVDVNDDQPKFVKPSEDNAIAYILENSPLGTSVFQLEAIDSDSGPNGDILYAIIPLPNSDKDGSGVFQVDPISGLITTKGEVNAELQERYELKVEAKDQGVPTPYSTSLTMMVVVLDKNDHKPEFEVAKVPYQISIKENETTCANISLAIDKDLNTTFTVICYYLIGSSLLDTFIMNTPKGMLCLNTTLDRERTPFVDIVIQALEDCYESKTIELIPPLGEVERYPPMYSPGQTDKLWIEIKVADVNDNPPRFKSKDLALGVTRVTQFGKFILELKDDVEDADSSQWGVDHFIATSAFTAHPEALRKELESLKVTEPFKLFPNGSVKTNMYFKPQMSGYFTVGLMVFDKGNLSDTARLRISLINDDQRLIIVFRRTIDNVGPIKDEVARRLGQKVGYRIVVDSIQTHETENGQADQAKTDMFIHGEDLETNEVVPAARLLSLIDQRNAMLIDLLNDFNVLQIVPTQKKELDDGREEKLTMALILVAVILGSICIILAVVLYYVYKRYQRKLKAATAMAYVNSGVEPKDTDLYKNDIPGTNIHSYEKPRIFEGQTRF